VVLGRVVRTVAAVTLLGSVGGSLLGSRCDLPEADQLGAAVPAITVAHADADPCASGCKPDCFVCSRSEVATSARFDWEPPVVVATVPARDARPSDGVVTLPYHPPHRLL
jgi:hypothetical protein